MTHSPRISRRRLLKTSFAFSAAALLGRGQGLVQAQQLTGGACHVLTVGDWGVSKDYKTQSAVASGMQDYTRALKLTPEAMLLLGDNFYGKLSGGVKSTRWVDQFENMYPKSVFPNPCYAVLGNHDYDDEPVTKVAAQLAYAAENPGTRWTMPGKWHSFQIGTPQPLLKVIALDSNYSSRVFSLTREERAAQTEWLHTELAKPRETPWLAIMAHHPIYSNGVHGDHKTLIKEWLPLLEKHQVNFYFSGHDHDLQHLEMEGCPTSFVISGGGGARVREIKDPRHGPYSQGIYGFTHLEITSTAFTVRHVDANRNLLHAFSKASDGKVTVL